MWAEWAEFIGLMIHDITSIWRPDTKGNKARGWLILLGAAVVSTVLALIAFTEVL